MKNFILFGIIFLSSVFARRDCLQQAELDALGRSSRPDTDTLAISPSGHFRGTLKYSLNSSPRTFSEYSHSYHV